MDERYKKSTQLGALLGLGMANKLN